MSTIKLLIVEDDFFVAEEIQNSVEKLGFEVSARVDNGKEAILQVIKNQPDLAIMDIKIKGEMDGIETASQLARDYGIPIIYLTDQSDDETFERAKITSPHAFLAKPITPLALQRSIELAITQVYKDQKAKQRQDENLETGKVLNKHYMLKDKSGLHAISLENITHLEADKQYCYLHTIDSKWHISRPMGTILEKLCQAEFCKNNLLRISKSYSVNLRKISKITGNKLTVEGREFIFGDTYRELLFKYIETV